MPTILAIETASEACSVAVTREDAHFVQELGNVHKHAEVVLSLVDAVLQEAKLALSDIDIFAFGRGPGSFTGLRVACSVAQGFGFAMNKPLLPISTLLALAHRAYRENAQRAVFAALDARMGEIYWGAFRFDNEINVVCEDKLSKPAAMEVEELQNVMWSAIGTGQRYQADFPQTLLIDHWHTAATPSALDIALLAQNPHYAAQLISADAAKPVYVRNNVADERVRNKSGV
jgi:tRNA threonylcarbamoyladenosine biosynthesis protein TsaB